MVSGYVIQHLLQQGSSGTVLVQWANGDPDELLNLDKEEWNMVDENDDERSEYDSDFSMSEVKHVLQSMAFSKAGGPDGVPMQVLQHLTDSAIQELTRIINMSWTSGMCPLLWKSSRLVPIPKSKPGAYRPISLTNAFARVADRLVTRRLTHFLERFQAIPGEQAGFRTAMSAEMQCCSFVEWISQRQQNGDSVNCVFLDASAAYDNVHHDILMARLGALDPPARLTKWINSFIRGREVDTKWGSTVSKKRSIHRGVPQGSSMSPVLWLLYMAPIFDDLKLPNLAKHRADFMPFLYADDIAIAVSSRLVEALQSVTQDLLNHVADFCRRSCITLNGSKSVQVVISTSYAIRCAAIPQTLNGTPIPSADSACFLGILVNATMSWNSALLHAVALNNAFESCELGVAIAGASISKTPLGLSTSTCSLLVCMGHQPTMVLPPSKVSIILMLPTIAVSASPLGARRQHLRINYVK